MEGSDSPVLLELSSIAVAVAIAVVGWRLARHDRRRDQERAELTEVARILWQLHVQLELLCDREGVATSADCAALRSLKYELDGLHVPSLPDATTATTDVVSRLDTFLGTAVRPETAGQGSLRQAQRQGRAVQEVLTAIGTAQEVVGRLRAR